MDFVINQIHQNKAVFYNLLKDPNDELILWKQSPEKWNLLYIICHLYDEERIDFKFRVQWILENPYTIPPQINPLEWIEKHDYINQNYHSTLENFLKERDKSIQWLSNLKNPHWDNYFIHPKLGKLTAKYFLNNWLAHDYLHIRQILKLKFDYLKFKSGENLDYAGKW